MGRYKAPRKKSSYSYPKEIMLALFKTLGVILFIALVVSLARK